MTVIGVTGANGVSARKESRTVHESATAPPPLPKREAGTARAKTSKNKNAKRTRRARLDGKFCKWAVGSLLFLHTVSK